MSGMAARILRGFISNGRRGFGHIWNRRQGQRQNTGQIHDAGNYGHDARIHLVAVSARRIPQQDQHIGRGLLKLSRRDENEARAATERQAPSLNQARRALDLMPATSPRQLRDRAVFALLCLQLSLALLPFVLTADESSTRLHPFPLGVEFPEAFLTTKIFPNPKGSVRFWGTR